MKTKKYVSDDERLSKEWHPVKNEHLSPDKVTITACKKVWWICEKGHEWQAYVNNRNAGNNCPYCAGRRAIPGETDLATVRPDLAAQWHPALNGTETPDRVTCHSNKKVWWQCEKGHEWESTIANRGTAGCPFCCNQRVLVGFNDLTTISPEIAKEWHPTKNGGLTPQMVTPMSNKKVWWICEKGHEWQSHVATRSKGSTCPYCSGHLAIPGETDLASVNPRLAAEWHPTKNGNLSPNTVRPCSNLKVWWLGSCGHEWKSCINDRNDGTGCPYCAGQNTLPGFNDFASVFPEIAKEWHPTRNKELLPNAIYMRSRTQVWWICEKGHEWLESPSMRSLKRGCPYCSNRKLLKGYNDLATLYPHLAEEWHPTNNNNLSPSDVRANDSRSFWWMCKEGHEWHSDIRHRKRGQNCPFCKGKRAVVGVNDLATLNPGLAQEWHPTKNGTFRPCDVKLKSGKSVWWQCKNGHEWKAIIKNRANGDNCPYCSGFRKKD